MIIEFLVGWILIALLFTHIVKVALEYRHETFNKYNTISILIGSVITTGVAQWLLWLLGWL